MMEVWKDVMGGMEGDVVWCMMVDDENKPEDSVMIDAHPIIPMITNDKIHGIHDVYDDIPVVMCVTWYTVIIAV